MHAAKYDVFFHLIDKARLTALLTEMFFDTTVTSETAEFSNPVIWRSVDCNS